MQFFAPTNTCKVRENKRIKDKSNQRKNISLRAKLISFIHWSLLAIYSHIQLRNKYTRFSIFGNSRSKINDSETSSMGRRETRATTTDDHVCGRPRATSGDHGQPQRTTTCVGDHGRPKATTGDHGRPRGRRGATMFWAFSMTRSTVGLSS